MVTPGETQMEQVHNQQCIRATPIPIRQYLLIITEQLFTLYLPPTTFSERLICRYSNSKAAYHMFSNVCCYELFMSHFKATISIPLRYSPLSDGAQQALTNQYLRQQKLCNSKLSFFTVAHRWCKLCLYMLIVFCLLAYKAIRGTPETGVLNTNLSVNSGSHSHKCQWFYVTTF